MVSRLSGARPRPRPLCAQVMNEPHRDANFSGGLPGFVDAMVRQTQADGGASAIATVDSYSSAWSIAPDLEARERGISAHHYWHYGRWQQCAPNATAVRAWAFQQGTALASTAANRSAGGERDKPALVSEFGQFDCYCPAALGFSEAGVGWIAWELMLQHDQFSRFQGILFANGTARDPAEADCLRGLGGKQIF